MKQGGFLKRTTALKSYTRLTSKTKLESKSSLKTKSTFTKKPDTPQKTLDKVFSLYIRQKDTDHDGYVKCATCPVIRHWKVMQCGHWKRRGNLATRYVEENCAPQCEECNCDNNGEPEKFEQYIESKYGSMVVIKLEQLANSICKDYPYEEQTKKYRNLLKELNK